MTHSVKMKCDFLSAVDWRFGQQNTLWGSSDLGAKFAMSSNCRYFPPFFSISNEIDSVLVSVSVLTQTGLVRLSRTNVS